MREEAWDSPNLGRRMRVACYGHWGTPMVLFPTATADHLDYQRFGLVDAMGPLLSAGVVKLYAVESVNRESWMDPSVPPWVSIGIQERYNAWVTEELVPFVQEDCRTPGIRIALAGASFGCFHAANQFFRRPDLFSTLIGLSGTYDLRSWSRGWFGGTCYLNSPVHFVSGLQGPLLRDLKKHCSIAMVSGRRRESPRPARTMARVLRQKRIPYKVDVWKAASHDWAWWNRMLPFHTARLLA